MSSTVFKINVNFKYADKDQLHYDICQYPFIEYLGTSRIDGNHMYKITVLDITTQRLYKINKIRKLMGKESKDKCSYDNFANDMDIKQFVGKYHDYIELIKSLEDHIPNLPSMLNRYVIKTM